LFQVDDRQPDGVLKGQVERVGGCCGGVDAVQAGRFQRLPDKLAEGLVGIDDEQVHRHGSDCSTGRVSRQATAYSHQLSALDPASIR
jgi:hypothetical protein